MNQKKIGKVIQKRRKDKGLPQKQLGEKSGVTYESDEVLHEQIEFSRKYNLFLLLSSIMQGVGVSLLFVPVYKEFSEVLSSMIVMLGIGLFVTGLCIKVRYNS